MQSMRPYGRLQQIKLPVYDNLNNLATKATMLEDGSEMKRLIKGFEAEALAVSLEMIASANGSDEWRCIGEAINWPSLIFDE